MKRTILFCLFSVIGMNVLAQTVESVTVNGESVDKFVNELTVVGDSITLSYSDGTVKKADMDKVNIGLAYQVVIGGTEFEGLDNTGVLENFGGKKVDVSVARSIYADRWNAICLPFDMSADVIESLFGKGTVVAAFDYSANGNVNFMAQPSIVAGVPYIIRPVNGVDGFFVSGVELKNLTQAAQYAGTEWAFVGTIASEQPSGNIKLIAGDNKVEAMNQGTKVEPFSAYLKGVTSDAVATTFSVDGDVTGIISIVNGDAYIATKGVYNLAGKYLGTSTDGLQCGVYIVNGKKQLVK